MFQYLQNLILRFSRWFKERAHGTHAKVWLFVLSFSEAIFFPLPIDPLLILILIAGASRWRYYAVFTTFASVLGGVIGYGIGLLFFDVLGQRIVEFYGLLDEMATAQALYDKNAFLAVFLGAFTPLPYKIFVLSGGFFKVNFISFFFASLVGRGLRYTFVAFITARYGAQAARLLLRYFNIVTFSVLFTALLAILYYYGGVFFS